MTCRMVDLRRKEVINIKDGMRLGSVCDMEVDTTNAKVLALVIYGRLRFFGLFGREDDIVIRWQDIQVIGDDTVLVSYNNYLKAKNPSHGLASFLGFK